MPARRAVRLLFAVAVLLLSTALSVRATHSPTTADVVAEATSQGMTCSPNTSDQFCSGFSPVEGYRTATITPASGPLETLFTTNPAYLTRLSGYVMDSSDEAWNAAMHNVGCDDAAAVAAFIKQVAALNTLDTSTGPEIVGECSMTGALSSGDIDFSPHYEVRSRTLATAFTPVPTPTPAPTPTPVPSTATPKPTAEPTAKPTAEPTTPPTSEPTSVPATPTVAPTATPTLQPGQTPGPTPSVTPSAVPTDTQAPTAEPTGTATEEPSDTPSPTPEEGVLGGTASPEPSPPVGVPDEGADEPGGFVRSVPPFGGVSTDPAALASTMALAIAMLLFMGFIGELFNNTVEVNYFEIMKWFSQGWLRPIGWLLGLGKGGVE